MRDVEGRICGIWGLSSYRAWRRRRTPRWPQAFEPKDEQKRSSLSKNGGWEGSWFWRVWGLDILMDINFLPFLFLIWIFLCFGLYCIFPLLWETTIPESKRLLSNNKTVLRNVCGILSRKGIFESLIRTDWDFSVSCSFTSFPLPPLAAPDSQEAATPSDRGLIVHSSVSYKYFFDDSSVFHMN